MAAERIRSRHTGGLADAVWNRPEPLAAALVVGAPVRSGRTGSFPQQLTAVGDRVFFTADDGVHGRELWTVAPRLASRVAIAGPVTPSPGLNTFTLTVSAAAAPGPTRAITIWNGSVAMATVPLPAGQTSVTWQTPLTPAEQQLVATYGGDARFAGSTSAPWVVRLPTGTM